MRNINGEIRATPEHFLNRGFLVGDALFETLKVIQRKILFFEDHYFRLMASMRICRMEIPMSFTMEYLEEQILGLCDALALENARVRFTVYRNGAGFYAPEKNDIVFCITAQPGLPYVFSHQPFEADLFRDYFIPSHLLSTIKTNNRMVNVVGSIFATENGLDTCLLLNDRKNVTEALNGNVFLVKNDVLKTPPLSEGCLNGIMRKQVLRWAATIGFKVEEAPLSPFEIQDADEMFITNVAVGIQPVTKYRKKEYGNAVSQKFFEQLVSAAV